MYNYFCSPPHERGGEKEKKKEKKEKKARKEKEKQHAQRSVARCALSFFSVFF